MLSLKNQPTGKCLGRKNEPNDEVCKIYENI